MASAILYNNKSDNIVVQKDISKIIEVNITYLGEVDITSPTVMLDLVDGYIDCNYMYIKEFKRYYYVTNITILDGYRLELDLKVDVLMSYASYILNSSQHITRQQVLYNLGVKDSETPILNGTFIQYKNADNTYFTFKREDADGDYCYVLNSM